MIENQVSQISKAMHEEKVRETNICRAKGMVMSFSMGAETEE